MVGRSWCLSTRNIWRRGTSGDEAVETVSPQKGTIDHLDEELATYLGCIYVHSEAGGRSLLHFQQRRFIDGEGARRDVV